MAQGLGRSLILRVCSLLYSWSSWTCKLKISFAQKKYKKDFHFALEIIRKISSTKFIKKCQKWSIGRVKQCYQACQLDTVFENPQKSRIQHLHFHVLFDEFFKSWLFCQTALPDRSILIGQKLAENAKIEKFKCDILSDLQTLWYWNGSKIGEKCQNSNKTFWLIFNQCVD